MKIITDSFGFLIQVLAVAFAAGLGWQLAGGFAIAITEHIRTRMLARRIKRQADESLDTIRRADKAAEQTLALQDTCCGSYFLTGGKHHADNCVFRTRAFDRRAPATCECPIPVSVGDGNCVNCSLPIRERLQVASA